MSKILYRPHRGGLDDAMRELREFNSIEEMLDYVYKEELFGDEKSIEDIVYEEYGSDSSDYRIGWKTTYIVCSKDRKGFPRGGCGWFTTNLSKEESLKAYEAFLNRR